MINPKDDNGGDFNSGHESVSAAAKPNGERPEGLARYEEIVTEPVTRLQTSWDGLRTFAPDRSLVVGADAAEPSFYWLCGQGGYGFQTAPAASELLEDLILGQAPDLLDKIVQGLSPIRFGK